MSLASEEDSSDSLEDEFSKSTKTDRRYMITLFYEIGRVINRRKAFISTAEYLSLSLEIIDKNDIIVAFQGSSTSFVLRKERSSIYKLLDEVYLYRLQQEVLSNIYLEYIEIQ